MATATRWVKVAVSMQSALGATKTISAISQANPGTVSSTAHGLSAGAYVAYTITGGMPQLNSRVLRITNAVANAWDIESVDTTGYDAFTSGTAAQVTFGTGFSTLMDASPSGGDQQFINYRLLHDDVENLIPSVKAGQIYTFKSIWDPADAALLAAEAAADQAAQRAILLSFSNGKKFVMNGYVGCTLQPQGNAGELVECTLTFSGQGRGKGYAT